MFCIKEDLGLIFYKNDKQRSRRAIFVCECGKESTPLKFNDVIKKEKYQCNSCSQIKHGLSKNKEHLNKIAKIWRVNNIDKARANHNKASAKYKEKNIEKINDYYYLKKYIITKNEAIKMKEKGCFICGSLNRPVIDHDHETGKIRGVLCDNHNKALGLIGDTHKDVIKMLEKYKEYFEINV